jgi:hypothetical protein
MLYSDSSQKTKYQHKKIMKKILYILIIFFADLAKSNETGFVAETEAELSKPFIHLTSIETILVNRYIGFKSPGLFDAGMHIQTYFGFELPNNFYFSLWHSQGLENIFANEIDFNVGWWYEFETFTIDVTLGMWDLQPLFSNMDDIFSGAVTISKEIWQGELSLETRYYYTSPDFISSGLVASLGYNQVIPLDEKVEVTLSPFLSYDDGFGIDSGLNLGGDLRIEYLVNDKWSVFGSARIITPITGENETVHSFGLGMSRKF